MGANADVLAARLIRNCNDVPTQRELREPLYDAVCARLARGTAAKRLGGQHRHRRARHALVPVSFPPCAGRNVHRSRRQRNAAGRGGDAAIAGGRYRVHSAGSGILHQIINTSDAPLRYLSISTREMPEICEYPDSGKYLAMAPLPEGRFFEALQRSGSNVDYCDGEP